MSRDEIRPRRWWPDWLEDIANGLNALFRRNDEDKQALHDILTELRAFRREMMRPTIEITVGKPVDKPLTPEEN